MTKTTMRSAVTLFGFAATLVLASCDTYSYKTPLPNKKQEAKNPYVYGDPNGPAKQSKLTYPTDPAAAEKAAALKAKLFGDAQPVAAAKEEAAPSAAPADSAATTDTAKAVASAQ